MSWDDLEPPFEPGYDEPQPADDPAVQELEPILLAHFNEHPDTVYYESQLAVMFERHFFHWVTVRALKELREARKIGSALEELSPNTPLRFYFSRRCRYWRRKADEVRNLVRAFSNQAFTRALGVQGELLTDAGLPQMGFLPIGREVRAWQG